MRSSPRFSIAIYCGSRPGATPQFAALAQQVGQWLGERSAQLVYGGGTAGLMGVLAQATRAHGGRVVGVIPESLCQREQANHDCDELHVVRNMHERKALMAQRAQAFLALPGGIGTLDELFEVWTWRQLGYHDKPIGVLNAHGYYDALLQFMQHTVAAGFLAPWQLSLIQVECDATHLLNALHQAATKANAQAQGFDASAI